jgi:hypothetical protein
MTFSLLDVNSVVSIKSLFNVINHKLQGNVFTLISTHFLPLPDCKTDTEWEGTPCSLCSWAASQLAFLYTLTQHCTSILLPEPERHGFTHKKVVTRVFHWRWSRSPSASFDRPEFEPRFLPVWWAVLPSPHWFLHLTGFSCASETLTLTCWEDEFLSGSSCPLVPGGISSWHSGGMHPGDRGGDNSPSPQSQITSPQEMLWEFASWDMGLLKQLAGSNILLCQHRLSGLMSKGWAPRTKWPHLIYPCKQVTEAKSKV